MTRATRVIKLGGSLLDWPELEASFRRWLAGERPLTNVVVVGGGRFVDALRGLNDRLSSESAHWLCIRAMNLTAAVLAELLGEGPVISVLAELRRDGTQPVQIFSAERFMREDARGRDPLPCDWSVSSDSIAARVASALDACELVLLKSSLPTGSLQCDAIARSGFVDDYFPRAAAGVAVRCVNLRDPEFRSLALKT